MAKSAIAFPQSATGDRILEIAQQFTDFERLQRLDQQLESILGTFKAKHYQYGQMTSLNIYSINVLSDRLWFIFPTSEVGILFCFIEKWMPALH
ncbi:MAG: hypothetical protein KME32_30845 [Mojavia pulchra JT2-VF2]|uniref:Uncharacterized protein n=1 Tax=Mojavia pulchra JT2-VF2 TaxID=287848 RepID=A0A951Q4X5_9NOST|nr:hypothetical protein [Mojavia pulchra JT2-VF2]